MAKKKAAKKNRPPDYDPNEKRRQRLEARRQEKAAALAAQRRAQQRERVVRWILLAGFAAALVWFFFIRGALPSEIAGHEIQKFSTAGGGQHASGEIQYDTVPPVSGEHAPQPGACGVLATKVPDPVFVHNLEHGTVALVYQPTLDPEQIGVLESIVTANDSHVLSAPNPALESPIAVAAWGHLMELDEVDRPAIEEFIEVFAAGGVAPEANQECPNTAEQPFAPVTPTPSVPVRTITPGLDGGDVGNEKKKD
ncbi:MAG TPA: DUF3105 domain-containing protein [Actinomycetota bacterium]|nr:DUF3105 domain-containing protein [Actinomycetota bacterium]